MAFSSNPKYDSENINDKLLPHDDANRGMELRNKKEDTVYLGGWEKISRASYEAEIETEVGLDTVDSKDEVDYGLYIKLFLFI